MLTRVRFAAVALAIAVVLVPPASVADARTDNRSKPIVFVHGLDAFGTAGVDCNMWSNMINTMRAWGWTGTAATVAYYEGDTNCSYSVDHHGSHATHFGGPGEHNGAGISHTADTQIEHLGYHLAWMIYDHFSRYGTYVDVVGHSMGGMIARYAIAQTQLHHADFPPYLYVEDVVTLGTPHGGSGWGDWCPWSDECDEIGGDNYLLSWLRTNASNPQGSGGTDWTTMGSYDDTFVSEGSAVDMNATHKVNYLGSMNLDHGDYYNDTTDVRDADVEWWDAPGPWYAWYDAPHAVRWSDYALTYGSW
jgi:pimeloyl-ACP methyl ester carboxylesterase